MIKHSSKANTKHSDINSLVLFVPFPYNIEKQKNRPRPGPPLPTRIKSPPLIRPQQPKQDLIHKESAMQNWVILGIVSYATGEAFVRYSAFIFAAGISITLFATDLGLLSVDLLIRIMETVIDNTRQIVINAISIIENPLTTQVTLNELHQYLTPYVRSRESIFFDLLGIVNYLERCTSPEYPRVDGLLEDYRELGNNLMLVYRRIEGLLDISIQDSPISVQDWEN